MSITVRAATALDLEAMVGLLLRDAETRQTVDPVVWKLRPDAREHVSATVAAAMKNENPPFRQSWLVAETNDRIVGVAHTILLPVPPIYAGEFGAPGLIMEDSVVAGDAPAETSNVLLEAAEADLKEAGARILLASSVSGGSWAAEYAARGYEALTLYLAKTGLAPDSQDDAVRAATEVDLPAIVTLSAINRQVLVQLDEAFWKPHPEADARFGNWMRRSLTLTDRDMFVSEAEGDVEGYAIAQPATALHFPPAHDIAATGFVDDFYHTDLENPALLAGNGKAALALFSMAEAALAKRQKDAALIVCPAAWISRKTVLEAAGYRTALTWYIMRQP